MHSSAVTPTSPTSAAEPFLAGPRIHLREVRPSDINDQYYSWMNDPAVTSQLESRFFPQSVEGLQAYVTSKLGDTCNAFLAIVLNEGSRHIGNIKLGPIDWIHRSADIGLLIGERDCWGRGYASEAISLVTRYAFRKLNLHKVTAGCYETNPGSAKAFQKVGFVVEGIRREQFFSDGGYVDQILLGMVAPGPEATSTL